MTQEQRNKKAGQLRLAAQIVETGCGWEAKLCSGWFPNGHIQTAQWGCPLDAINSGLEIRILPSGQIKEPVIPVPEGWRELSDGEKDGEWVVGAKYLDRKDGWKHCLAHHDGRENGAYAFSWDRIIVPVAKPRVPLEPGDVPPGSVIRAIGGNAAKNGGWAAILVVIKEGLTCVNRLGVVKSFPWEFAMHNQEIKRPTDTEWQPCSKEAP